MTPRGGLTPIDTAEYRQDQSEILDVTRHWSDLSKPVNCAQTIGDNVSSARHPGGGGFYPCDTADVDRLANAAADVAADVQR